MNYLEQVKRVKDQIDGMIGEIHDGIAENPGDNDFFESMDRLLVIIEELRSDVSPAIDAIEEANLQHLP